MIPIREHSQELRSRIIRRPPNTRKALDDHIDWYLKRYPGADRGQVETLVLTIDYIVNPLP